MNTISASRCTEICIGDIEDRLHLENFAENPPEMVRSLLPGFLEEIIYEFTLIIGWRRARVLFRIARQSGRADGIFSAELA